MILFMIDFAEFKKFFIFNLIGSLIISALIAVVTVLIGDFNDISGKVLWTLVVVILHSLVSLAFIWNDEKQHTFEKWSFFASIMFLFIVLSFIVSVFTVWEIIPGDVFAKIYATFFVIAFAALHGEVLSKALDREEYLNVMIYVNYLFMLVVVLMFQPLIYVDNAARVLGEAFFRIFGAVAIIDGTLSLLIIIFYKLYMHKHPKIDDPYQSPLQAQVESKTNKGLSAWVWVLIIFLIFQIIGSFLFSVF